MKKNNSNSMVTGLLHDFNVKTEDELYQKLYAEGSFVNCVECGRQVAIEDLHFLNGNPVCWNHRNRGWR